MQNKTNPNSVLKAALPPPPSKWLNTYSYISGKVKLQRVSAWGGRAAFSTVLGFVLFSIWLHKLEKFTVHETKFQVVCLVHWLYTAASVCRIFATPRIIGFWMLGRVSAPLKMLSSYACVLSVWNVLDVLVSIHHKPHKHKSSVKVPINPAHIIKKISIYIFPRNKWLFCQTKVSNLTVFLL